MSADCVVLPDEADSGEADSGRKEAFGRAQGLVGLS